MRHSAYCGTRMQAFINDAQGRVDIPWADTKALSLIDEVVERCRGRRLRRTGVRRRVTKR